MGPSRPLVQNNQELVECPICYADASPGDAIVLRICGHVFCSLCLSSHVKTKMESGTNLISCPSCKNEVCQNDLRAIVGVETFATLERRALEGVVATDPSLHHCPTPDCPNIVSWASPADGPPGSRAVSATAAAPTRTCPTTSSKWPRWLPTSTETLYECSGRLPASGCGTACWCDKDC